MLASSAALTDCFVSACVFTMAKSLTIKASQRIRNIDIYFDTYPTVIYDEDVQLLKVRM